MFLEVGTLDSLIAVGRLLDAGGIIAGYRAYPVVPEDQCGLRFALTAGHERAHIDQVLSILSAARGSGLLPSARGHSTQRTARIVIDQEVCVPLLL